MEETLENRPQQQERPPFLTVLCVLTFIGSGLGAIGSLGGIFGGAFLSFFGGGGTAISSIISLVACALCIFGAVRMWGLYKNGFILYVLGAILSIAGSIVSVLTVGAFVENTMEMATQLGAQSSDAEAQQMVTDLAGTATTMALWMGVVWTIVVNGVFIALYGINRKHLTK